MTTPSGYTPVTIDMKKVIGTGEAGTVKFYSFAPISLPNGDVVPPNPTAAGGATVVLASDGTGSVDLAPTDNAAGLGYGTRYIVKYTGVADATERLLGSIQVTTSPTALSLSSLLTANLTAAASSTPDPSKSWYTATSTALMLALRNLNNGDRVFVDGKGIYRAEVPPVTAASGNLAMTSTDGLTRFILDEDGKDYRTVVNALAYGADPTGATDSSTAISNAMALNPGKTVYLPAGTYRLDSTISYTASVVAGATAIHAPGPRLVGDGMQKTFLDVRVAGPALKVDPIGSSAQLQQFQWGGFIRALTITRVTGNSTVGARGLDITGWWHYDLTQVQCYNLDGDAIKYPLQTGYSANPDDYASLFGHITECRLTNNSGWGINAACSVGWGGNVVTQNYIGVNNGGGIYCGGHQNRITSNSIFSNGYNGSGGLKVDKTSGQPTANGLVVQDNEFDNNFLWHILLVSADGFNISQNRFNSWVTVAFGNTTSLTELHPATHIKLGDATNVQTVARGVLQGNYHRSQFSGSSVATTDFPLTCYRWENSTSSLYCRVENNNFSTLDNTPLITKYSGISSNSRSQVIEDGRQDFLSYMQRGVLARINAAQNVSNVGASPLCFESTLSNQDGDWIGNSTATYTSGAAGITLVSNLANWAVGSTIKGPGIPAATTLTAYNSGTGVGTLSANATASWTAVAVYSDNLSTGDTTSGSQVVSNVTLPTLWKAGMKVTGTGIPASTFVLRTDSANGKLYLSNAATATNATISLGLGHGFLVPYTGLYRFDLRLRVNAGAAGDRVRLYLLKNGSTERQDWQYTATISTAPTVKLNGETLLNQGDILMPGCDQINATAQAITTGADSCTFSVRAIL